MFEVLMFCTKGKDEFIFYVTTASTEVEVKTVNDKFNISVKNKGDITETTICTDRIKLSINKKTLIICDLDSGISQIIDIAKPGRYAGIVITKYVKIYNNLFKEIRLNVFTPFPL